ncbi:sister chromatid cohesion protein DCC1 [Entomortierella parvispora]|uniref:Sister chromatid cohesion protein DCC1 n=1 Tax=Entomortierella parvispora TaxID=205924 RepID=A0A9P3LRZ5_9FUNG|nr:sister chromatid cohesion protein DCC1 [Entomortierella parvispora]
MANPSTQAPDNATTTDLFFARDFVQSSYTLLELPKSLEEYINNNSDNDQLSFQVRGLDTDTAVLCTPTQTFSLQRAHTSNMLLPIAPIVESRIRSSDGNRDIDMNIESNGFMDQFPPLEDKDALDGPQYERQAVLDILDSVLDLIPISPRLERLGQLLRQNPFEGWAQESHQKGHLYTWAQIQSIIQASDKEILQWLKKNHACLIEGHWRLFKVQFMYEILQEVLMTLNVLEMRADAVDIDKICQTIEEDGSAKETGIEKWMIEHCLKSFSNENETEGLISLSAQEVPTFLGTYLLSRIGRGNQQKLEVFVKEWEKSLHGHFQADLVCLAGECIVELDRVIDRNQTIKSIRYFSKSHLPNDPAMRFTALFEIKAKWEAQEIRPFLRDLVLDEKKLDILLLKHARSVKQPGGDVIYSSRIISKK